MRTEQMSMSRRRLLLVLLSVTAMSAWFLMSWKISKQMKLKLRECNDDMKLHVFWIFNSPDVALCKKKKHFYF